ncbi:uncharacterized protein LOC125587180 [Brassica napus]|uniref:uncharacterized protein LOC125587180 n=1 Tax=Brassica napus TaxID=3708 RepID=UPI00207ADB42|nr:uncharacterized protein LOC125587180 [Brassica napus]
MYHLRKKPATLVFIDDIKPWNNSYKLKVQVMKLWKLWRSKKIVSIEMVLEDATGTRIHASIDEDLIQIYEGKVSEGVAFFISNFTLVNYATEYRTNPFPYKLPFYRTTNITPCDDFPSCLPNKYLKNFSEIHYGILKNDVLIDVVGQIVQVCALTEIYAKGKQTNKLNVILRDEK